MRAMPALDLQHTLDLLDHGNTDEAIGTLQTVVEQVPMYVVAYVLLARAYEQQERWDAALDAWERAHFLMPTSPVARNGIERVLDAQAAEEEKRAAEENSSPPESAPESSTTAPPSRLDLSTPEEMPDALSSAELSATGEDEELDHLIQELESARIEPDPNLDSVPAPDLDNDIEDMVSETLARIYTSQKQYGEAARVYTELASQKPKRAQEFLQKAAEMRDRAEEEGE